MPRTASLALPRLVTLLALGWSMSANAEIGPLLQTTWGQGGDYQSQTPLKNGERTYPGCTTVAAAQVLYHYQYTNQAASPVSYDLQHGPLRGADISHGRTLEVDLPSFTYDFDAMATDLEDATAAQIRHTATFIYHVGVTLNAQFGGGAGSSGFTGPSLGAPIGSSESASATKLPTS